MTDPISLTVADGDVLTVTADAGSYGTVFGPAGQWTVSAKSPLNVGPGHYRIETIRGVVRHSVQSRAVAALEATLPRATEIISTAANVAANIAGAIVLSDKFRRLAERSKAVPVALAKRADRISARWDAVEEVGTKAFDGHESLLDDAERGVSAAEDALNQLTNGGN